MTDNTLCACGCGGVITQPKYKKKIVKWLRGHNKFNELKTWESPTRKFCNGCEITLSIEQFSYKTYTSKTTGEKYKRYRSQCKICNANETRAYKQSNTNLVAEKKRQRNERLKNDIRHHAQEKIAYYKKKSNIPSDLTVDYLVNLYQQQKGLCYFSNIKMIFGYVNGKIHHNSISLDKLNPLKGYVQGNVVWCSYLTNTMKQTLTEDEFYQMIVNINRIGKKNKKKRSI